jgi:hypothetical protein
MRRALIVALGLLAASEARSASDVYAIDFPPPLNTPIIASTCDGLDLHCRMDWEAFFTPSLQPFKWSLSVFRFAAAPQGKGNQFAFVEVPYVEHGEEDYARLQQMLGQTGTAAERFWIHGDLGFPGADFETLYLVSRVALPSRKVNEAIAVCVFPVLNEKTTSPDRCGLLAFKSGDRKFLLSSIGFAIGHDQPREAPHYALELADENRLADTDAKADILRSRHALEEAFDSRMQSALEQGRFFENAVAKRRLDNFSEAEGNISESSYLVLREQQTRRQPPAPYRQIEKLGFRLETGGEWRAYFADGGEESGIELLGGKDDWSVTLNWETRTAIDTSNQGPQGFQVYTFYEPKATGTDIVERIQEAFLSVMKEVCAPMKATKTDEELSALTGRIKIECGDN